MGLDTGVTLPECPAGGPAVGLDVFMPNATTQTLLDGDSNPIVRVGTTDATGAFSIMSLAPDGYDLGYEAAIELADHTLSLTATVDPVEALVEAGMTVTGVAYTITDASCAPTAP